MEFGLVCSLVWPTRAGVTKASLFFFTFRLGSNSYFANCRKAEAKAFDNNGYVTYSARWDDRVFSESCRGFFNCQSLLSRPVIIGPPCMHKKL